MHNNQLDKFIETLIEEMSTKQLWKLVFNKMTNAAKRQMLGEMLNTLMGSGYSTSGNMFDYNPKKLNETNEEYVDFTQKVIYKPWKNVDENMHKENEEDPSKEQDNEVIVKADEVIIKADEVIIKADEVITKTNKLLASLEEIKELNTKALIKNKIEILSTIQSIITSCIKEVEGQYYSKAVEEIFYSITEKIGKVLLDEHIELIDKSKVEGNNNETTIEEN